MHRRQVIKGLGLGAVAAVAAGCAREEKKETAGPAEKQTFEWRMATTWPANFPGLGTGASALASNIETCSAGRLKIKVYGANELVPAFEVFDAVSSGTAEMGQTGRLQSIVGTAPDRWGATTSERVRTSTWTSSPPSASQSRRDTLHQSSPRLRSLSIAARASASTVVPPDGSGMWAACATGVAPWNPTLADASAPTVISHE